MNRLIRFSDGQKSYSVPEEEAEAFQAALPTARRMTRFIDRAGKTYSVPDEEADAFREALPEAEELNSFQLANGSRSLVPQSRMSKFLRSREFREGDAAAREAMRSRIDAETPMPDAQGVVSAAAEAAGKGALRTVGKYGGAFVGIGTGPMRAVGSLFGRDNALVKGADWVDDKLDWFAEDLGVGGTSGNKAQDVLSGIGEIGPSVAANLMPWMVGGGAASKIAGRALFAANVAGAGGRSATETYDKVKEMGGDDAEAYTASLQAQAVSTAAAFVFGKLSVENYLKGFGAKGVAKLIEGEVKTAGKGFNGIVKAVANGHMRRDIAKMLIGSAEEGVTEGAESFLLSVIQQHAGKDNVDFEEATLTALKDAAIGAGTGLFLGGLRVAEGSKGFRGVYEKQARAEVSQLMADMAPGDIREMNPKKFDEIAKKFGRGEGVSRKDADELGLPPNWSKEQRNEVFSEWQAEKEELRRRRAKMDGVQEQALRDDIAGFVGDGPEAQRVYDRVVMKLKDATVLDDPTAREKLIGEAAEAEEAAIRAENDAQERANAEALAREENRDNEFMLAREEARAKGGQNEAGANETSAQPDEVPRVTPPAGEAARPVEAGEAQTEVGGKVGPAKTAVEAPTSAPTEAQVNTPPTTTESVEGGPQSADAVQNVAGKKTARVDEKAEVKKPTKPLKANPKKAAEVVKEFASKDESRPLINHIHHDHGRGLAVATDGRILIATKHGYDPNYKEDSQNPFPKWRKVVPSLKKGEGQTITIDPNAVLEATKAVKKLASGIKSDNMIRIKLPNGEHTYMSVNTLSRVAKAMAANGINDITTEGPFKPLLAKNNDTTIVAMPMRSGDGDVKLGRNPETSVVTFDLETGKVISAPESKISKMRRDFAEKLRTDIAEGRAKEIEWLRTTGLFKGLIAAQKKGETDAKKVYEGTTREDGSWDKLSEANKKFFTEMLAVKDTAELENKFAEYLAKEKDSKKQSPLNDWVERAPKELAKLEKEIAAEDAIDAMMADVEPEPAPKSAKRVEGASRAPETAAKKPFEERYREWAEEDAPAWAKDLSPEDKAEYERLLDDVTTDKGETDAERAEHVAQALAAIEAFEKAHTPKRGRGRPKKVAAETKAPEAKVEPPKTEAAAEPEAPKSETKAEAKAEVKEESDIVRINTKDPKETISRIVNAFSTSIARIKKDPASVSDLDKLTKALTRQISQISDSEVAKMYKALIASKENVDNATKPAYHFMRALQSAAQSRGIDLYSKTAKTKGGSKGYSKEEMGQAYKAIVSEKYAKDHPEAAKLAAEMLKRGLPVSSIDASDFTKDDLASWPVKGLRVNTREDAANICRMLSNPYFEVSKLLFVDKNGKVISGVITDIGLAGSTKIALSGLEQIIPKGAYGVIASHNHPSGKIIPSGADRSVIPRQKAAFDKLGIKFLDHIITDTTDFYSMTKGTHGMVPYGNEGGVGEWWEQSEKRGNAIEQAKDRFATVDESSLSYAIKNGTLMNSIDVVAKMVSTHDKRDSYLIGIGADGRIVGVVRINDKDMDSSVNTLKGCERVILLAGEKKFDKGLFRDAIRKDTDSEKGIDKSLWGVYSLADGSAIKEPDNYDHMYWFVYESDDKSIFKKAASTKGEVKEPKSAKIDMKPVIAAMHKLGDLAMSDVATLEKALREAEARGQADRADNIRTFLDYKKSVGVNADPKSDKTQGGRYRASIESEKPLDDPKFRAWAKRRGAAPTQQKREEYDAAMVKQATKRLSRWIKGVSVKTVNFIAPEEGGDVRHSIKQEEYDAWNKVLDDYERGLLKPNSHITVLQNTPAVLRRLGAPNLKININKDIIDKITGIVKTRMGEEHKIPVSELRNLQIELDNPIAVFDSKSRQNAMVVLTRIIDNQNNERAVVALHLDKAQGAINVNDIASMYGKDKQSIENWTAWGLLRYVNKQARKSSAKWFQLPSDSELRAHSVFTEKDFSDEELGRIVPKSDADSNDAAYLDAVNRSDMETARRMVREAAARAMPDTKVLDEDGLPLMVYHGTYQHGFTVFKAKDEGVYTSSSKENAEGYSFGANSGVYDLFVNAKNPLIVDAEGSKWSGMKFKGIEKFKKALNTRVISPADLAVYAREHGYDGVIIKNVFDGDVMGDDVIVYQSSQIKSADLVTYDDAGNVIPLSQRFNPENNDIRYLRDGKRIVGSYNLKTGEVTLAKGASVETVAHELGWHAAFDWAKRNAATNKRAKALYERMRSFADEAPDAVKAEIAALYGKLDADAFADEVGAALFTRGQAERFAGVIDPMVDAPWYKKAWRTVVDIVKDWLSSHGMNRVDLDGVEEMSERRFSEFLATAMLSGKTLGERKGFSMDLDMSKRAKWERKLSDRFAPIKELMERVEGNNGEAYRMARTLEGMAQMGKNRAERAMKRVDKILVANDISPELLAQYMQAMAYEERNAKIEERNRKKDGSGMTQKDAEDIFAEIDERGIREKCQEAADILWKLQTEGLQARVDAGLIDHKTAVMWMLDEPHHVPWRDAIDPDTGEWMGRNFAGKEFEIAEGRSTFASGDPITLMLQEYENAYARAAENALRQNLADIARLNTDVGTIFDSIQVDAKGHRSFIKFPAKGEKAKMLAIPDGSKIESTKAGDGGMANILTYRENGKTKYLALNGSLGEAIAAAVTGRSLLRPPALLSKFMRGYAVTATAWSPTFAIRNTMADHFDIHGNMVKDFGLLRGEKMYAKMVAEEVKMSKELLQYVHTGDFAHDANGKATTAFGKLIEEYEAAGGLIGGLRTEGYDVIQKRIRADFRSGRNKLRSVGRELAAGWTDSQKMSELSTRLAAFKVMKESGMSAKEAAMWSRESTVDFNKKGNWTPISNILWMFSNSALGSGVRQAKGLLTTKNGLQLATGLAAWGFIEGMLECAMNEGYDDEEEKRGSGTGADLNEYTRQNSAYLRFGDTVYRTNLHMGPYGIIKYAGNVAARVMCGRLTAEKAAKELGLAAAEVAAAFTGIGNVSADALLETGMPTALQPFVQGITGKDYAGRPLYRKKYDEAKPDSSHGRKSTAAGYQWLAKKVNEITGGDEYSKGGIDIAPETVKLITETAGKNFVRDIVNIVQTSVGLMSGDNEPRNIPFVRDAVRKVDGNEDRYYEALRRYDADKLKLKDPNLKGEERRSFLNAHPWLKSNGKKGSTVVSTLETRIKDLMKKEENPNLSDERKEELKTLRRRLQARVIERMSAK